VVKSAGRKRLVGYLQSEYHISQRRACRLLPISRKAIWYQTVRPDRDADVIKRLKQPAEKCLLENGPIGAISFDDVHFML